MCGISGSGKSTIAKDLAKRYDGLIVSTDRIREELFGDANVQRQNGRVFELAFERLKEGLETNHCVIFDAANLTKKDRTKVLEVAKNAGHKGFNRVCWVNSTLEDAVARNLGRERKVPTEVIERQFNKFEEPTNEEGWEIIDYFESVEKYFEIQKVYS
jgi:predicted kinase